MDRQPSLFISHGSPMFALEPGRLGPNLRRLGETLRNLVAVVVVSPHWQTRGVRVAATPAPATIHDFGGFPTPLYQLQYPAPCPARSARIRARSTTCRCWWPLTQSKAVTREPAGPVRTPPPPRS